jgi:hypothetical protein
MCDLLAWTVGATRDANAIPRQLKELRKKTLGQGHSLIDRAANGLCLVGRKDHGLHFVGLISERRIG